MYKFNIRRMGKIVLDLVSIFTGFFLAHLFRHELLWSVEFQRNHHLIYMIVFTLIYLMMNLQNKSWRYTSILEVTQIIAANIISGGLLVVLLGIVDKGMPATMVVFTVLLCISLQLFNRYIFRMIRHFETRNNIKGDGELTLVIGAGEGGEALAKESRKNPNFKYDILGYIDDNPKKQGIILHGYRVMGGRESIPNILEKYRVKTAIIAIPSATSKIIKEIRAQFVDTEVKIKVVPAMEELLEDSSTANQLRDVKIEDLL